MAGSTAADLFARHHRDIHRYLARMTGRRDAADDLSQEVFVRVVRALANGGPVGHERGWIFSIARHLLIDRFRETDRSAEATSEPCEAAVSPNQGLAIDLSRAIGRLAQADRDMFLLREIGGLSYDEIAATCECSVESVRSRLYRARIALRDMLAT